MKLRQDVKLAPADRSLRQAAKQWLEDESSNLTMGFGKGLGGVVEAKRTFATALEREGSSGLLGIYRAGDPVGYVLLMEGPTNRRAVRFQMYIDPQLRGKAVAPSALAQLADKVLLSTKAHRLETEILAKNRSAKKWLQHEGFTQESFRKHSWWKDGAPRSTVVLRLLAPDWRRIKSKRREVAEVA